MTAAIVFDSSAIIAFVRGEPGYEKVVPYLGLAAISAVNLQEVVKVLSSTIQKPELVRSMVAELSLDIHAHEEADAFAAAALAPATRRFGSGLGDRSCLALAIKLGVPALTTDRAWAELQIPGLQVVLAR